MSNTIKGGNVNVNIGEKKGIYAGSASNMGRLFIFCNVVWALLFSAFAFYNGVQMGNLEAKVAFLEELHK
jgi:hypothetical protein